SRRGRSMRDDKQHIDQTMQSEAFLARRYRREKHFRLLGLSALIAAGLVLAVLLVGMIARAQGGLWQHFAMLPVDMESSVLEVTVPLRPETIGDARFDRVVSRALQKQFADVTELGQWRKLRSLISRGAEGDVKRALLNDPALLGTRQIM